MAIVLTDRRIAYMAVPKAGCSSVKTTLARIDPAVDAARLTDVTAVHGVYPTARFRPHRWAALSDHFRFTVVRDPVRRLLSVYTDRVLQKGDLRHSRKMQRGVFPDLPVEPDPDTFFCRLGDYMAASSSIKHHAISAWLFTGRDLSAYDRVYRTDEMDVLARDLSRRTGMALSMPRRNASAARLSLSDLSQTARRAIEAHTAADYEILGPVLRQRAAA